MDLLLPHLGLIVWTVLAFLIVLFILKKYAWKTILNGLNERETNIANSIASAEKVKLEMAQLKSKTKRYCKVREKNALQCLKKQKTLKIK